jgi:hypothetical protein
MLLCSLFVFRKKTEVSANNMNQNRLSYDKDTCMIYTEKQAK